MRKNTFIYSELINSIKTTKEADDFSLEISALKARLFKPEKTSFDKGLKGISLTTGRKIAEIYTKNNLNINDKEFTSGFLENLTNLMKEFKIIKLILSFDPAPKTIEKIHNFVKDTIGNGYILDIEVAENIIGGAIVIFNGKYNDFSLKKTLEQIFANKREEVLPWLSS